MPAIPGVRLEEVIGRGGFATVYGGVQESVQRPVAVKVDSRPLDEERNRRRYLREVQATGRISGHPHVVSLVDTGVLRDGRPYIVMERCDGGSLDNLAALGPLPAPDAVRLVLAAASALGAAHAAGILHRDVKPANILLDSYGSPRLTDFGIAAVVREQQDPTVTLECLTPDFAPPEAFELQPPTPAGDVWSMGATLFYLLTGRGPRRGPEGQPLSLPQIVRELDTPVDLSAATIPRELRPLLSQAMHRDPRQRFADGTALSEALAQVATLLGDGGLTVAGPGVAVRLAQAGWEHGAFNAPPGSARFGQVPAARRPAAKGVVAAAAAVGLLAGLSLGSGGTLALSRFVGSAWASGKAPATAPASTPASVPGAVAPTGAATVGPADQQPGSPTGSTPGDPAGGAAGSSPAPTTEAVAAPQADAGADAPFQVGTCLNGLVSISGVTTTRELPCSEHHTWEVFATGTLSDKTTRFHPDMLNDDPQADAVCSLEAAMAYGEPSPTIRVLGPNEDEWNAGVRGFSCVVSPTLGGGRVGSYADG